MVTIVTERGNGSKRIALELSSESNVEQSHVNECNINDIIARYNKSGLFPQRSGTPTYGDFTGATDFHDAQNRIVEAKNQFMELPADIRALFDNDPGQLLEFVLDADNKAEAVELGLLPKDASEPEPEPVPEPEPGPVPEPIPE